MSIPAPHHYIDAFMAAVPTTKQAAYRQHVAEMAPLFKQHGALRVVECWGDNVPHGTQTDFFRCVQAREDETVVFSWIEWPDKATRDAGMQKMMEDPRMDPSNPDNPPMPFDGKRMIFGGFKSIVRL